jgi:hypothetical protein
MSAPGNSLLMLVLLALFVACCGYVAGRVHQRRQEGRDYEKAYRDGYDTATRSAFSLAARVIGPKRTGARGPATAADDATTALPGLSAAASDRVAAEPEQLGFQAPPPPPANTVVPPAAVGGVIYQPFPDPRPGGSTSAASPPGGTGSGGPVPAVSGRAAEGEVRAPRQRSLDRRRAGHHALDEDEAGAEAAAGSETHAPSAGRHTVPDELVQAATYRLPPDRVFRARIPDSGTSSDEPACQVPKPRES